MSSPYVAPGLKVAHKYYKFIDALNSYVAESHGINVSDLKGKSRKDTISQPRFICMYMLKEYTDLTLDEIALAYNRKSHGTALNAINDVEYVMGLTSAKAKYLRNYIKELRLKFTSKYLISQIK